jgi:hypothetical protein
LQGLDYFTMAGWSAPLKHLDFRGFSKFFSEVAVLMADPGFSFALKTACHGGPGH